MSTLGVQWNQKHVRSMPRLFQLRIFFHLLRIAISLILLPLDNAILFTVVILGRIFALFSRASPVNRRWTVLQDVHFYPKTVLVTGVDTPYGLAVARAWYYEGHRVVGAEVTDIRFTSGGSKSKALSAFYRVPRSQYVARLVDIIQREKADIWIPCSQGASIMDDAVAKQSIESRTSCRCVTLGTELVNQWGQPNSFIQYLIEKDLPVMEGHQVQSRDSIHKILHRSPTKSYHMRRTWPGKSDNRVIIVPKRTASLTYSEVSEMQISKDIPWSMQQCARTGEFLAEMLVVHGHVRVLTIRPAHKKVQWRGSPLIEGLATAIHNLMDRFALLAGPQLTGHLCLRLMVDDEMDTNSVRYVVHIAESAQGAASVKYLLQNSPSQSLVDGYLEILSLGNDVPPSNRIKGPPPCFRSMMSQSPNYRWWLYRILKKYESQKVPSSLRPITQRIEYVVHEVGDLLLFWKNPQFSLSDPVPWWWHIHIYLPLREVYLMIHSKSRRAV